MTKVDMSCVEVAFKLLSVKGYTKGLTNFTIKIQANRMSISKHDFNLPNLI